MQTRYFKFPDMETSFAMAQEAGLTHIDETGEPRLTAYTNDYAIDVVGVIRQPTGNMIESEDGFFYPETAPVDGWHVNVRVLSGDPVPENFLAYEVFPENPTRVFA